MKIGITQADLENPQRFIGEGLGAPEFEVQILPESPAKNYEQQATVRKIVPEELKYARTDRNEINR